MTMILMVTAGLLLLLCTRCSAFGAALTERGIKGSFHDGFNAPGISHYQELTTRVPSDGPSEVFTWLGSLPTMREWGQGRLAKGLMSERYEVVNGEYEITLEVDRKEWEDQQFAGISLRVQEMGAMAAGHKDYLLGQLLLNGDQAGFHSYDEVPFFSDQHSIGLAGAQSNILTPTAVDADNPTTAEFRASLAAAIAQMISLKNDQNLPFRTMPTGLVCVVPPTMLFTALEAVNATLVASTTNSLQGAATVISLPDLTDASKWFLLKVGGVAVRPFIFLDRIPVKIDSLMEGSSNAFMRGVYYFGARGRYTVAYAHWHLAIQSDFTAAG